MQKNIFLISLLFYSLTCHAKEQKTFKELWEIASKESVSGYPNNAQKRELYSDEYKRVDKLLNKIYKKAIKNFGSDKREINNLKKAQRFWIKYKEAECYTQAYPYRGGTGELTMVLPCLIELTEIRTKILKDSYIYEEEKNGR